MAYPPKIGVPREKQFTTRLSAQEMAAMKRVYEAAGLSRSDYVRTLIREDLKLQGEKL